MPRDRAHRVVSSSGVTPSPLGHPTAELVLSKSQETVESFVDLLLMMKMVVVRGKILFQTLDIWIVTFLENGVISAFLYTEKWSHNVVLCFLLVSP